MPDTPAPTRIQRKNRAAILEAALDVFSTHGFRGATLDQIADGAGLSKPNLLYYFNSKEAVHIAVLSELMDTWLDPLRALHPDGDPKEEILAYMQRKLTLSRTHPRESRLFANEVLQGAPRIGPSLKGELKSLVDEKAAIIAAWVTRGALHPVDPHHLIFSIWSLTQHYADFEVQIQAILGEIDPFETAEPFLITLYERLLRTD
jgi:TetR/AcrR family transcriptional regulator